MIPFFEIKSDIKGKKEKEVNGRSVSCRGPPRGRAPPPACGPGRNPSSGTTMPAHRPRRLAHGRGQPKNRHTTSNFPLLPSPGRFQLPVSTAPNSSGKLSRLLLFERGEKGGRGRRRRSRRSPPPPMASGLSGGGGDRRAPAVRHR